MKISAFYLFFLNMLKQHLFILWGKKNLFKLYLFYFGNSPSNAINILKGIAKDRKRSNEKKVKINKWIYIVDGILGEDLNNFYAIYEKKVNRLYFIYVHSIITLTKENRFFKLKKKKPTFWIFLSHIWFEPLPWFMHF